MYESLTKSFPDMNPLRVSFYQSDSVEPELIDAPAMVESWHSAMYCTRFKIDESRKVHEVDGIKIVPMYFYDTGSGEYRRAWIACKNRVIFSDFWTHYNMARSVVKSWKTW